MNSLELAKSNLKQALERVRHAREAADEGNHPFAVRQAQEAVALALKAALRLVGIEPQKWHDVGPILKKERSRFPKWFADLIDEMASTSRALRNERETAMYGDEEAGIPPEDFYTKADAERALEGVEKVTDAVKRLLQEASSRLNNTSNKSSTL